MLLYHKEFEELYNCSFYNVSDIPLEQRQHTKMGYAFIASFFFFEILYIPCIVSIKKHCDSPCYKMMYYIAIVDVLCMFMNTLLTGYLAVTGAVYCSHPTLIYLSGTFGLACWACESTAEVVLALNRCTAICSPKWEDYLFRGRIQNLALDVYSHFLRPPLGIIYQASIVQRALHVLVFQSSRWVFDDFGLIYNNEVQVNHNYFVIVGLTTTYLTFAMLLHCKSKKVACQNAAQQNYSHKMIFLQVVMISMVNAVAASVYIVMQLVRISQFIIYLGSIAWVLAHGIPPVIYLAMNKTMRKDAIKMTKQFFGITGPKHHSTSQGFPQMSKSTHHLAPGSATISKNSTIGAGVH
uniref:Uncharacterized protein n=1 Tax=Ditylenchus dipsaci TaxID=166011 RepID=A0A915E7A3_9BILA